MPLTAAMGVSASAPMSLNAKSAKSAKEKEEFWISGFDEGNIFSCINDSSFTDPSLPESIPLPENTGFVVVFIDNFPVVMVVAKQAIQKGEGLWLNYGETYWAYKNTPVDLTGGEDAALSEILSSVTAK